VTALPGIVEGPLGHSILAGPPTRVSSRFACSTSADFATDKHRQIDDYPYGGGAGMVLKPEPIFACIEVIKAEAESGGKPVDDVIYLTPDGQVFDQSIGLRAVAPRASSFCWPGTTKGSISGCAMCSLRARSRSVTTCSAEANCPRSYSSMQS
jgi:hypothetical protein